VLYSYLADLVVVLHTGFVLFVMLGGILVLWKSFMAWYHVPAVIWAAAIELFGWICPLTPLENILRARSGEARYATGFVEHYIMPVLYPDTLTREMQIVLGFLVLGVNIAVYLAFWQRKGRDHKDRG
jgi:hypothetical protein